LRRNKPFAFAEPSTQLRKVNVGPNGLYKHAATTTLHLVSSVDKKNNSSHLKFNYSTIKPTLS